MIHTLDQLIAELCTHRESMGGDCPIALKDTDTGWHLRIKEIRRSKSVPVRLLIESVGYHDDTPLPR